VSYVAVEVVKASGEVEPYSRDKVVASLIRCGVPEGEASALAVEVERELPPRVTTHEIHRKLESLLRRRRPAHALRYVLRRAIMRLGPEGYPFEKYFARLLNKLGYSTWVNVVLEGRCADHEVDIVAEKGGRRYMIECKYHNAPGTRTDLKVALYVYARFLDLRDYFDVAWIVTNTKLTLEAVKYVECVGMRAVAWRYPEGRGLEALVEETRLYPITVLSSLGEEARRRLLASGYVTLEDLWRMDARELASIAGVGEEEAEEILEEAKLLKP